MTITAITTILTDRKVPTPPPSGFPLSTPQIFPSPDFPFKGYHPPLAINHHKQLPSSSVEPAIVIDNGSHTLKAGFSHTPAPYLVIPPLVARVRDRHYNRTCNYVGYDAYVDATTRGQIRNAFEPFTSIVTNWDVMESLLDYTFLKLGISGSEHGGGIGRPVVMTEPVGNLGYTRRMMNEILFECYSAPSVAYGIDSLFSYRQNKGDSGLIVSTAHSATHVIPVLSGRPHLQSCARLNWGGSHAQDFLLKLLRLKYPTFPGKMSIDQMDEYVKKYCYVSQDYTSELSHYLDWDGLESSRDIVIQYPFTEHVVAEKSAEELARIAERKKESGRRLQEQAAKMRLEKLIKKEQELEYYKRAQEKIANAPTKKEQRRLLDAEEFKDEAALERMTRDLEKSIRKSRKKDLGGPEEEEKVEEQSFPLLDIPDDQLDEQGLKDKRHQRLLKSGVEARQRAKAEKERERARVAEEERLDEVKRETQFDLWVSGRRVQRDQLLARIKDQARLKADLGNRKSLASQMRMKTLANLASDSPATKRKRRGGANGEYDDDFGANDDDWGVYRTVATEPASDDEEGEEDPVAALKVVESELLKYDPAFEEKDTLEAQNDWTKSVMHAFLRGARPFDAESTREAHQIHLNVERIRVGEVVWQPGIAGIDQAGLVEVLQGVVLGRVPWGDAPNHGAAKAVLGPEQSALVKDIFLTGGLTLWKGFEERLRGELRSVLPDEAYRTPGAVGIRRAADPVLDAWRGAGAWWHSDGDRQGGSLGDRDAAVVSRAEYLEKGSEYIKEHALGNSVAPTFGVGG